MKILKNAVIAAAALTMVATPIAATAAPVAPRASVQLEDSSAQADQGFDTWLLAFFGLAAIVGGFSVLFSNHSQSPTSP